MNELNTFWSTWVIVLAVLTFGISFLLLCWAPWVKIPTQPDGTTTHVWAHGVLREGVRDLPRWWLVVSFLSFLVAALYLVLFPGFGGFRGVLGWDSTTEMNQATADNATRQTGVLERVKSMSVEQLSADPEATRIGRRLFVDNCSSCHGRQGRGVPVMGAPNLVDRDWLYGGDGQAILTSILEGRQGVMPAFGATLEGEGVGNLAHYVVSLSGKPVDAVKAVLGKPLFQSCAACHGPTGKGNPALGAPNLSDEIWLHGGSITDIEKTIRDGRSGVMPAWRERLGEDNAKMVAAWIFHQSHSLAGAR